MVGILNRTRAPGVWGGDRRCSHSLMGRARRLAWIFCAGVLLACAPGGESFSGGAGNAMPEDAVTEEAGKSPHPAPSIHDRRRSRMVEEQLRGRDITDPRVLRAMGRVPRHSFVNPEQWAEAYADRPLPIPKLQTISQPYIVALMTQLARPDPGDKALDIGTGSGYQAAVLAELVQKVYSVEIHCELADSARDRLERLGYRNVEVRCGDGYRGWPERAPFDVIILAAAPAEVPPALVEQLAPGGRLVLPVGGLGLQELIVIEKRPDGSTTRQSVAPVAFVPMTGEARDADQREP